MSCATLPCQKTDLLSRFGEDQLFVFHESPVFRSWYVTDGAWCPTNPAYSVPLVKSVPQRNIVRETTLISTNSSSGDSSVARQRLDPVFAETPSNRHLRPSTVARRLSDDDEGSDIGRSTPSTRTVGVSSTLERHSRLQEHKRASPLVSKVCVCAYLTQSASSITQGTVSSVIDCYTPQRVSSHH